MAVIVRIPTPLRPFTAQQASVEIDGATVGQILERLTTQFAELRPHLFGADGSLRSFVNVYLNDEDVRYLDKERTAVSAKDTISIVPSVAGGTDVEAPVDDRPALSHEEVKRYSRHLIMPEIGVEGQQRLKAARVLCIGAGGLGSPASLYLAAAGVGTLGLVDFDTVDFSNLQRQILYSSRDVGRRKLEAASDRLTSLNPGVRVVEHEARLSSANALDIVSQYDIVVDGADNFPTRYLVNDACVLLGKPNAYGSIFRFEGQASVFATKDGPCYRCLYPEPPPPGLVPSCAEGGVLGVLPGMIGIIQATEAIKLIIGVGEPLIGRFMIYDALKMKFRELKLRKDPDCPVCGTHPTVTKLIDYEQFCGVVPAAPEPVAVNNATELTALELKQRLDRGDALKIVDVREPNEYQINRIPGSQLIPLGDIPKRYVELNKNDEIVVQCKSGARSAKAADFLRSVGFTRVLNLKGGILDWVDKVDPSQPKY